MEANRSDAAAAAPNPPRDLMARLYREIGVSAVAAALGLSEMPASTVVGNPIEPSRQAA